MTKGGALAAGFLLALAPALAAGCSTPPKEIDELRSADADDRIDAATALTEGVASEEPDFVAAKSEIATGLRALLDDRSALVRQVAVDSLAKVEGKTAAGAIADRLRDRDPWVRYAAAKRLGDLEARSAAEPLAEAVRKDESHDVRRAAAQALARIKPRSAVRDLYFALSSDENPSVRHQAWRALKAITGQDLPEDARAWRAAVPSGTGD